MFTSPPAFSVDAALMDALVSASEDHVYVLDAEDRFLYVCTGGAGVLGAERLSCLHKTAAEMALPRYFQEVLDSGLRRLRAGEKPVQGQIEMPAQNGGPPREFDYTFQPLPGGASVCAARDVTERNQARREAAAHLTEMTEANAALDRLAATDGLTGLLNYRALRERLAEEFVRAGRYRQPLSVLMLDLDHFKAVNDTRGHEAGDDALRALADVLRGTARESDIVGRFGGEEFVVVLPQTDSGSARPVAERMRAAVEAADGPLDTVTVSIGVCALRPDHADFAAILRCVDAALYRSKAAGRNQVAG